MSKAAKKDAGTKSTNHSDDEEEKTAKDAKRTKMQKEFDTLRNEMEIAQYGTTETGQLRRKLPRHQSRARTQKRRLLERQDASERAVEVSVPEQGTRKRLRGSRAAAEDHVIQGSLVFGSQAPQDEDIPEGVTGAQGGGDNENDDDNDDAIEPEEEFEDEAQARVDMEDEDDEQEVVEEDYQREDDDDQGEDDDEEEEEEEDETPQKAPPTSARKKAHQPPASGKTGKKRRMYRLKAFTSQRMAQRHGDALGAHARGLPKVAIQKLKQIAREVPSASQVYSSLGMVYEDMLRESRRKQPLLTSENAVSGAEAGGTVADEDVPDKMLAEQLDLARKAYGAYHVAAILCKKDYTLWLRAADSAAEIADLHSSVSAIPRIQDNAAHFHRLEKERWLSEAKSDYKVADNLKPPGIDVPAKLAAVLIQLGSLSEALTLLTDLKNSGSSGEERSEFEASYKAWLLYADLMLRIGHECTKWNSGIQTNENYMFRRWLRKLSTTFDWKERRLQALSMALEAATGSKTAIRYIEWLQKRAVLNARDDAEKAVAVGDTEATEHGAPGARSSADQSTTDVSPDTPTAEQFEREKSLLLDRNKSELAAFDKTTKDVALEPGSIPMKEREKARDVLVKNHKATVVALVGEYHQSQTSRAPSSESAIESAAEQSSSGDLKTSVPPSASCLTVYRIAPELMRHLIDAQLYDGARLVGEAVSSYLKERAALLDKRKESRENYQQLLTRPTSIFALQREVYDAVDDDRSGGEDSDVPLSDEDELEESFETPTVQQSLRRGALPPELRVLYGLSLVGEGGRNFLAAKCLESLDALEQEPLTWSTEDATGSSWMDCSWMDCHRATSEPLGRSAAYALTVDVLRTTNKEKDMAVHLAPMFSRYFELLKREGGAELSLKIDDSSALYETKIQQVSRVVLASFRYQFYQAELLISKDDGMKRNEGKELAMAIIESLFHFFSLLWKVGSDASVAGESIEVLSIFTSAFALLSKVATKGDGNHKGDLTDLTRRLQKLVSLLCGGVKFDLLDTSAATEDLQESTADLAGVPFSTSWLSSEREKLLLRTNNLCIATNVSLFSGWEVKRFSLRLLRHRDVDNFFGLTMHDEQVAGYLGPIMEEELSDQWDMLNSQLPEICSFNFRAQLVDLQATTWYIENEEKHKARQGKTIPSFGEDVGLSILLIFSRMCMRLAAEVDEQRQKDKFLFTSMSILLPMSQFSLNQKLLDAKTGTEDAASSTFKSLVDVPTKQLEERLGALHNSRGEGALLYKSGIASRLPKLKPAYVRPARRTPFAPKPEDISLHEWFNGENTDSHLVNLVAIPCSVLQHSWADSSTGGSTNRAPESAAAAAGAMQKLHTRIQELRACCSEQAVEKACLEVAGALVELAPVCHNPFLCLQQAAIFAGNASKGGNCNFHFREPLPSAEACTPLEALVILGRADCLQAVYFCPEAAFLCSYVASVWSQHRNRHGKDNFEWNDQWKIVSIMAYNVSVMIRHTALMLHQEQDKRDDLSAQWEIDAIAELRKGRTAGLSWKASLRASGTADLKEYNNDGDAIVEYHAGGVADGDEVETGRTAGLSWEASLRASSTDDFEDYNDDGDAVHDGGVADGDVVDTGDTYAGTTSEPDAVPENTVPAVSMVHQDDDSSVEMFAV